MKKNFMILLTMIGFTSMVLAEGPLKMKGFHHDMSFEEGCQLLKSFKKYSFYKVFTKELTKKKSVCGFVQKKGDKLNKIHNLIVQNANGGIQTIILNENFVNNLFNTKYMTDEQFLQGFIDGYDWINQLDPLQSDYPGYYFRSTTFGWQIVFGGDLRLFGESIGQYPMKRIVIQFFEPTRSSFTEGVEPNLKEKVLDIAQRWSQGERATTNIPANRAVSEVCTNLDQNWNNMKNNILRSQNTTGTKQELIRLTNSFYNLKRMIYNSIKDNGCGWKNYVDEYTELDRQIENIYYDPNSP